MASGFPGEAARQINRLFLDGTTAALTDGQLLERFATRRPEAAEAAFETLVVRHGPMVLRVARGVLRDPRDVEDAFQATFLVLVRKASTISDRELLGPWLHGVARRVALKARGVAARRNRREGTTLDDPPADPAEGPWPDLRPILHEELDRLPAKYRQPVVLCHLQGLTHAEAARELAWPVGTVSVRLARARKLLKERLARRGLTATAALWAAGLAQDASAAVPEALARSTARAALQASASKILAAGAISAGAAELTRRTLTMMLASRLKWTIVPLALGLGAAGGVAGMKWTATKAAENKDVERTNRVARQPVAERPADEVNTDDANFNGGNIKEVPPGFFDVAPLATKDATGPAPVKPGQIVMVEVLEALPGRPITGERVVRPDGTISLGFYGDVAVAGLNRNQIKVKVLEHLRKYINDETLGLWVYNPETKTGRAIPPLESNRVFVDDDVLAYERPAAKADRDDLKALGGRIDELDAKLGRVLKELEQSRIAAPTPGAKPPG